MATIEDAIKLAVDAHSGVTQRDGSPYILHPLAVMLRLHSDYERMTAVLHDVVEDTDITLDDLHREGYPPVVVEAVDALTRRENETYEAFIERIKPNALAVRVKLADLEHNMDVRRLPVVTQSDTERLEKYRRAWMTLKRIEDAGLP